MGIDIVFGLFDLLFQSNPISMKELSAFYFKCENVTKKPTGVTGAI